MEIGKAVEILRNLPEIKEILDKAEAVNMLLNISLKDDGKNNYMGPYYRGYAAGYAKGRKDYGTWHKAGDQDPLYDENVIVKIRDGSYRIAKYTKTISEPGYTTGYIWVESQSARTLTNVEKWKYIIDDEPEENEGETAE